MRHALLAAVVLFSGCATTKDLDYAETRQRIELNSTNASLNMAEDRLNQALDRVRRLEERVEAVEYRDLGEWNRPECAGYKPEAQRLFCRRVAPKDLDAGLTMEQRADKTIKNMADAAKAPGILPTTATHERALKVRYDCLAAIMALGNTSQEESSDLMKKCQED